MRSTATEAEAQADKIAALRASGCEVWLSELGQNANDRLLGLLKHLASEGATNVLVEGGGKILGALNELSQIDEVHVFTGAKLLGGQAALSPVGGTGPDLMQAAMELELRQVERIENDIYAIYCRSNPRE